jgi:flagellar motor switch/type III secretory pathway protein FliN
VNEVFTNPDQVMSKFVLNIYYGKLQEYVQHELDTEFNDSELYLKQLYELYANTNKLSNQLATAKIMGSDQTFLDKLTKSIFGKYLLNYIEVETKHLKDRYVSILNRFYESKNHQKKPIPSGSIQELKRDLQVKIGRANINIGNLANLNISTGDAFGKETFLSEEVAISIIQETKDALQRCETLSHLSTEQPIQVVQILELLLHYLCEQHLDYAIELGLMSLPNFEAKAAQEIKFFEIVQQCNGICHLFEKQFYSSFVPLVASGGQYNECIKRKRDMFEHLENKLNNGLEKCVAAIVGWIKTVLATEQKKTDFKPETDDVEMVNTSTCLKVARFLSAHVQQIRHSLDGKNVEAVLMELGIRFHKVVYEHLLQFQYSSIGAMLAILDVNAYRVCAEEFKISLLNQLFSTMHALCNLLVVEPKNLKVVSNGESLVSSKNFHNLTN